MIVNLTPHPITLFKRDAPNLIDEPEFTAWVDRVIPRVSIPVRLEEKDLNSSGSVDGITVVSIEYGHLTYSPPTVPDTFYIVSLATALAVRDRSDFLVPYQEVRNLNGTVIGCRAFAKPC
jgi:hypothetical protein